MINTAFQAFLHFNLQLGQPAVCQHRDSTTMQRLMLREPGSGLRYTAFVEIMAPMFSAKVMDELIMPNLNDSYTGYGGCMYWGGGGGEGAMTAMSALRADSLSRPGCPRSLPSPPTLHAFFRPGLCLAQDARLPQGPSGGNRRRLHVPPRLPSPQQEAGVQQPPPPWLVRAMARCRQGRAGRSEGADVVVPGGPSRASPAARPPLAASQAGVSCSELQPCSLPAGNGERPTPLLPPAPVCFQPLPPHSLSFPPCPRTITTPPLSSPHAHAMSRSTWDEERETMRRFGVTWAARHAAGIKDKQELHVWSSIPEAQFWADFQTKQCNGGNNPMPSRIREVAASSTSQTSAMAAQGMLAIQVLIDIAALWLALRRWAGPGWQATVSLAGKAAVLRPGWTGWKKLATEE